MFEWYEIDPLIVWVYLIGIGCLIFHTIAIIS